MKQSTCSATGDALRPVMVKGYDRTPGSPTHGQIVELYPAAFHGWGCHYDDCGDDGVAPYSTAIVEKADGTVDSVVAHMIRFLDRDA